MKKLFIIVTIFLAMVGCASINFNPDTGEINYTRIGDQHIQGLEIKRTSDGSIKVKMNCQQSNAEALTEAIKLIGILSIPK